jgi:hypothetical protein
MFLVYVILSSLVVLFDRIMIRIIAVQFQHLTLYEVIRRDKIRVKGRRTRKRTRAGRGGS